MIIGNGLIAQAFKDSSYDFEDCIIFASGVSDSKLEDVKEFTREFDLVKSYQNSDEKFIYFSSIHMLDPSEQHTMYVQHKIEIESFIENNFQNYIIYRLPIIVGKGGNKKSLFNFLFTSITKQIEMNIFVNAYRYILDVDSVVSFVAETCHVRNKIINLVANKPFSILKIMNSFEKYLQLKAKYKSIDKGNFFQVDNSELINILPSQEKFKDFSKLNYIASIIKKYY